MPAAFGMRLILKEQPRRARGLESPHRVGHIVQVPIARVGLRHDRYGNPLGNTADLIGHLVHFKEAHIGQAQ